MTQDFRILRCCECKIFQVHQVKKSNKWNCKVCGTKQSVRQVYGKGSGADCRRHVQKLNALRGVHAVEQDTAFSQPPSENPEDMWKNILGEPVSSSSESSTSSKGNKWSKFLQDESEQQESTDGDLKEDQQTFSHGAPSEEREPHPVFRCGMAMRPTHITCPDALQKEKKQIVLPKTVIKKSQNPITSGDQVNQVSLGTKPSSFTSVSEKLKWSQSVKTSDSSKGSTSEKQFKPVINKNSKWSHFMHISKPNESEKEDDCGNSSLNDISHVQNVKDAKPSEGEYKGFHFILKASLQSKSTDFSTDF